MVDVCAVCGLGYFYIQARFDRRLGCAVLIAAAVLFLALANRGHWWAPFVLVGVAAVDWAAYRMLPRAAICYKCLAEYRGFRPNPEHRPYELATASHFADHDRPDTSQGDRDRV